MVKLDVTQLPVPHPHLYQSVWTNKRKNQKNKKNYPPTPSKNKKQNKTKQQQQKHAEFNKQYVVYKVHFWVRPVGAT